MQAPILISRDGRITKAISEKIDVCMAKKCNRPVNVKIKEVEGVLSPDQNRARRSELEDFLRM